ncbi:hypothetical protein RB614_09655 [Phytohabitans sp. ZYX-F-186]|uniref:Pentapeptide repeat protein n=1 Tax=Phytohabitans maris TaxID=3071409 RepID=A0ABU0ZCJ1_9ACTN|nr:hypothetical protein [Phytohabitans sp. ZYX-F-186]MDQ7904784.1 hypothetical protein [Phytohabitans sp. ZYX-F-186]
MTSIGKVSAAAARPLARVRLELLRVRPGQWRLGISVLATLAGAAWLVPGSWWRAGARLLAAPDWRWWLPVLLLAGGLAGIAGAVIRGWASDGRRPATSRAPLFAHVALLLLVGLLVAVAAGASLWWLLGRPDLAATGSASSRAASAGAQAWSTQNTFDAMKIVLSVVAGIGGVVALTVAYRRQGHSEAAERREETKLFNERFGKATDQLGSDKAAIRLAGVYAMAGLADDWTEGRQTCLDVLCAYLRMPYTPPAAESAPSGTKSGRPPGVQKDAGDDNARQERQVRHTVIAVIRDHLQEPTASNRKHWHGHRFDLMGTVFDGGDFRGIHVARGTELNLQGATFARGHVSFFEATFSGGFVDFGGARFAGAFLDLAAATFSGGRVNFGGVLSAGEINFNSSRFSGSTVDLRHMEISGGSIALIHTALTGGHIWLDETAIRGGTVSFTGAAFSGTEVTFRKTEIAGGLLDLSQPTNWSRPPAGLTGQEPGVAWPSSEELASLGDR